MKKLLLWTMLFLLTLCFFQPLQAQEGDENAPLSSTQPQFKLNVAAGDNPLVIRGQLDENSIVFSGNVRLTVIMAEGATEIGSAIVPLRFLPADLQHTTNTAYNLNRTNVTIPAGTMLTLGQPQDVAVTINNVSTG